MLRKLKRLIKSKIAVKKIVKEEKNRKWIYKDIEEPAGRILHNRGVIPPKR